MGVIWFGIGWCLLIAAWGAGAYFVMPEHSDQILGLLVMLSLLEVIGVILIGKSLHMGCQRATFQCGNDTLRVTVRVPFVRRVFEWPLQEVESVKCAPSKVSTNGIARMNLQITPKSGPPVGLLVGQDSAEIRWIADVLTKAIRRAIP